jgi:dienelactone hydrolase
MRYYRTPTRRIPLAFATILVCHGADDPFASQKDVEDFQKSMRDGKFDWEFAAYGNAVHSFTNPEADGSFNAGTPPPELQDALDTAVADWEAEVEAVAKHEDDVARAEAELPDEKAEAKTGAKTPTAQSKDA